MADNARKKNETKLLLALGCGATVEQAAREAGLTARTVYRRLEDARFRRQVQKLQGDMVRQTAGTLTAAATEAVKTLLELMKQTAPPPQRLGVGDAEALSVERAVGVMRAVLDQRVAWWG